MLGAIVFISLQLDTPLSGPFGTGPDAFESAQVDLQRSAEPAPLAGAQDYLDGLERFLTEPGCSPSGADQPVRGGAGRPVGTDGPAPVRRLAAPVHHQHAQPDMGMFDSVPGTAGPGAVWDERRFVGFDFAHCAAMIHPDATPAQLDLSSYWLAWDARRRRTPSSAAWPICGGGPPGRCLRRPG